MRWVYAVLFMLLYIHSFGAAKELFYYEAPKKAMNYYETKIKNEQYNRMHYYNAASVYKEFGENRKAFDAYRKIITINDSEIRAHFELAKAYYFLGAFVYAEEEIKYLARRSRVNWEVYYWWGCVLIGQTKYDEAIEKFQSAITDDPIKNLPYLKMAETYELKRDYANAIDYYKQALKKDKTYSELNRKIAQLYENQKDYIQAYNYWKTVGEIDTKDVESREKLEKYAKHLPRIKKKIEKYKSDQQENRDLFIPPVKEPVMGAGVIPVLRIGLMKHANTIYFKSGSNFEIWEGKGKVLLKGKELVEYVMKIDKKTKQGYIQNGGKKIFFKKEIFISKEDPDATTSFFDIKYGQGFYWASKSDTTYRGNFKVVVNSKKSLTLINLVNAEEYLFGVIPSEIPAYWPEEALRAQAVAARTYTFKHLGQHNKNGYDMCSTQHCAVYKGVSGEHKNTNKAVLDTKGQVLFGSNYKLLPTFFSHCCGGHTQDVEEIWGMKTIGSLGGVLDGTLNKWKFPLEPFYLEEFVRTFPELYCTATGKGETSFRWIRYLKGDDLEYYVNRKYKIGKIKSITPIRRAKGGAITKIEIKGSKGKKVVRFDPIRNVLGKIRSNVIKWEYRVDKDGFIKDIYIYGAGWGHSVGMCQRGIKGMAEEKKGYKEILYHYFPGSYIKVKYK